MKARPRLKGRCHKPRDTQNQPRLDQARRACLLETLRGARSCRCLDVGLLPPGTRLSGTGLIKLCTVQQAEGQCSQRISKRLPHRARLPLLLPCHRGPASRPPASKAPWGWGLRSCAQVAALRPLPRQDGGGDAGQARLCHLHPGCRPHSQACPSPSLWTRSLGALLSNLLIQAQTGRLRSLRTQFPVRLDLRFGRWTLKPSSLKNACFAIQELPFSTGFLPHEIQKLLRISKPRISLSYDLHFTEAMPISTP